MKNEHSTSGIAEDIIRSITNLCGTELHYKTLIEKTRAELENGIIDVENPDEVNKAIEKNNAYLSEMQNVAQLRRRMMLSLFNMYEGDKDAWCLVKHLANASETAYEAFMASDDNPELMELWIDTNKAFITALTRFLGVEITDCAACFSDMMKGEN